MVSWATKVLCVTRESVGGENESGMREKKLSVKCD